MIRYRERNAWGTLTNQQEPPVAKPSCVGLIGRQMTSHDKTTVTVTGESVGGCGYVINAWLLLRDTTTTVVFNKTTAK